MRFSPLSRLASIESQLAIIEADIHLREHEAWRNLQAHMKAIRQAHLEALVFVDDIGELRQEQGVLQAMMAYLTAHEAGPEAIKGLKQQRAKLLEEQEGLREVAKSMQNAGLDPNAV